MASLFPAPQQYFDNNGDPLAGGKVYFYEAGTTTPKDTYTTQAGTIANANPVILDSAGRASIWGTGSYKEVVKTSADVTISTKDAVTLGSEISDGTVTNAMLADMAANTVKARVASTSGVPSDLALSASTLLGRGSTGNLSQITLSGGLSMSGTVLSSINLGYKAVTARYYAPSNCIKGNSDTTLALSANRLYFLPIIISATQTFTRISINVTTLSAGNARLGIFNDTSGAPSTLVLDAGTVSTTTTGLKEVTISQSVSAGVYWLGFVCDATPTVSSFSYTNNNVIALLGVSGFGGQPYHHIYKSFTYGALPSDASGSQTADNGVSAPWIGLKV